MASSYCSGRRNLLSLSRATFDLASPPAARAGAGVRAKAQELEDGGRVPGEFAPSRHSRRPGAAAPPTLRVVIPGLARASWKRAFTVRRLAG